MSARFGRLLCAFALVLAGCDGDGGFSPIAETLRLQEARLKWARTAPASYSFVMELNCYCIATQPMRVVVEGGEVVSVRPVGSSQELDARLRTPFVPIPALFDRLAEWYGRHPHSARTAYHATLGYPIDVYFDFSENVADEEAGFRISDVRSMP